MQFTVEHPLAQPDCTMDLCEGDGLAAFARTAEAAGFDAIAFSDHPAPPLSWIRAGGHASLDPLAALAFCGAVTTRIRLMTYLLVLPFRNPFLLAKSIATVDRLSGGRLMVGAAAGYLRSEFAALGVDFDDRATLVDEALDFLRRLWDDGAYTGVGKNFTAVEQVSLPAPLQLPCPPLWIGGNGKAARRRVARFGDGWSPMLLGSEAARHTRTAALTTPAELAPAITELHELVTTCGRDPSAVGVQVITPRSDDPAGKETWLEKHLDHLGQLAEAGVTRFIVRTPADDVGRACEALADYGANVIARTLSRMDSEQ